MDLNHDGVIRLHENAGDVARVRTGVVAVGHVLDRHGRMGAPKSIVTLLVPESCLPHAINRKTPSLLEAGRAPWKVISELNSQR
jgi:hypothetical protein